MKKLFSVLACVLVSGLFQSAVASELKASINLKLHTDGTLNATSVKSDIGYLNAGIQVRADFPKSISVNQLTFRPVSHCVAYETRFDGEGDVRVCVQQDYWNQLIFKSELNTNPDEPQRSILLVVGNVSGFVQTGYSQSYLKSSRLSAWIGVDPQPTTNLPATLVLSATPEGSLVSSWFTGLKIAKLDKSIDQSAYLDFEAEVSLQAHYKLNQATQSYELVGLNSADSKYKVGVLYYEHNTACRDNACIEALSPITGGYPLQLK